MINLTNDEKYLSNEADRIANLEWNLQNIKKWNSPLSIDLTFRFEHTPASQVRKEYQKFVNRLSKRIFPNSYKRYGLLVHEVGYLEFGTENSHPHIHTIIETPLKIDPGKFKNLIDESWTLGHLQIRKIKTDDLKHIYNTKFRTKNKNVEGSGKIVTESLILVTKY
jgi:hypothetical protein